MNDDDLYAGWRQHLTPTLRDKFERKGAEIVQAEIGAYSTTEKRQAAQVWLAEQRSKQASTETRRFWIIAWIAGATLVATIATIVVTIAMATE